VLIIDTHREKSTKEIDFLEVGLFFGLFASISYGQTGRNCLFGKANGQKLPVWKFLGL
jgi:hypothetical protein